MEMRERDSVRRIAGDKIQIAMNIQIGQDDFSEQPLPFDSDKDALEWIDNTINKFKSLDTIPREKIIELVERCEKLKQRI